MIVPTYINHIDDAHFECRKWWESIISSPNKKLFYWVKVQTLFKSDQNCWNHYLVKRSEMERFFKTTAVNYSLAYDVKVSPINELNFAYKIYVPYFILVSVWIVSSMIDSIKKFSSTEEETQRKIGNLFYESNLYRSLRKIVIFFSFWHMVNTINFIAIILFGIYAIRSFKISSFKLLSKIVSIFTIKCKIWWLYIYIL